jgi:endonuclease YncB( thermonuclease family)
VTTWTVPATVLRIVDGDTISLRLDLGWRITLEANARVIGINAPEMSTPEGQDAKRFAADHLPVGAQVTFVSKQLDKYGRPLGSISYGGADFGELMLTFGHAVPMSY